MEKSISDMYLAASLLAYGATYKGADKSDPKRQKFVFIDDVPYIVVMENGVNVKRLDTPKIVDVQKYFTSKTLWFPPGYADAIRAIKSEIHAA